MQYSPRCAVPYVSNVDAGTVELVQSCGASVRTSANLIQLFEARWTGEQYGMHVEAGRRVHAALDDAWRLVAARAGRGLTEYEVQQSIRAGFAARGLVTDHGPIVAVNAHASNPHYEPTAENAAAIAPDDLVLIDLWAKLDQPQAVYFDITWMGFCGAAVPERMANVFAAVAGARDSAVALVKNSAAAGAELGGWQVDDAARGALRDSGFAEYFFHRTGHSIGEEVHGNGANMDNYETHDERRIIPGTCFSVEPGVYLPAFGVRSEVNVYRGPDRAEVTGPIQDRILPLLP
jgi:Xaa-Pro aminopeptidase